VKNLLPLTEIVGIAEAIAANASPHAMLREERILMLYVAIVKKKKPSKFDRRLSLLSEYEDNPTHGAQTRRERLASEGGQVSPAQKTE
jgi:hypothetical protein